MTIGTQSWGYGYKGTDQHSELGKAISHLVDVLSQAMPTIKHLYSMNLISSEHPSILALRAVMLYLLPL